MSLLTTLNTDRLSITSHSRCKLLRRVFPFLACLLTLITTNEVFAQKPPAFVVEDVKITTEDKVDLKVTYFKGNQKKETPVLIFLHGKGGSRQNWKDIATVFQKELGFAVVTVDLRGSGDSNQTKMKKPDYQAMVLQDMEAVKQFLLERHQDGELNMNKLGIVGCDVGAAVAIAFTNLDWQKEPYDDGATPEESTPRGQDVQALVLISPDPTTPGLLIPKTATELRNFPKLAVMVAASDKSGHDLDTAKKVYDQISVKREKSDRVILKKYPDAVRGMNLVLQNKAIKLDMADFLTKNVTGVQSKWQDRRSRVDR